MDPIKWSRTLEAASRKPLADNELDHVEQLADAIADDPVYVMLQAVRSGSAAYRQSQAFHRVVNGSGIATVRLMVEDGLAKYLGRGKVVPTPAGLSYLREAGAVR